MFDEEQKWIVSIGDAEMPIWVKSALPGPVKQLLETGDITSPQDLIEQVNSFFRLHTWKGLAEEQFEKWRIEFEQQKGGSSDIAALIRLELETKEIANFRDASLNTSRINGYRMSIMGQDSYIITLANLIRSNSSQRWYQDLEENLRTINNTIQGYTDALTVQYLKEPENSSTQEDDSEPISTPKVEWGSKAQLLLWLHELGILDIVVERCKEKDGSFNMAKAAKVVSTFLPYINTETIRKALSGLWGLDKKNDPRKAKNYLKIEEVKKKIKLS